jgi:hypothetical protein
MINPRLASQVFDVFIIHRQDKLDLHVSAKSTCSRKKAGLFDFQSYQTPCAIDQDQKLNKTKKEEHSTISKHWQKVQGLPTREYAYLLQQNHQH